MVMDIHKYNSNNKNGLLSPTTTTNGGLGGGGGLPKAAAMLMMRRPSTTNQSNLRKSSMGLIESLQSLPLTEEELVGYRLKFNKLMIPDEELSDTSINTLNQTISQLNSMIREIKIRLDDGAGLLDSSKTNKLEPKIKVKGLELVEDILREVALYSEFVAGGKLSRVSLSNIYLGSVGDELDLDKILQSEADTPESFSVLSPFESEATSQRGALSPLSPYGRYEETVPLSLFEDDAEALKNILKTALFEEEQEEGLLQWVPMISLSRQIYSDQSKDIAGYPTSLSIYRHIIVGTSRGLILVFDFNQTLKWRLALEHGSIISLSVSSDGSWVAAGFSKGLIIVWDLKSGRTVSTIFPVNKAPQGLLQPSSKSGHLKGSQIRHLKFIGTSKNFISGDDNGHVFLHTVTLSLVGARRQSKRIYGGSNPILKPSSSIQLDQFWSIISLETLPNSGTRHYLDGAGLVAIVTAHTLSLVCTKPKIDTLLTIQRVHLESGVEAEFGKAQADFYQYGLAACSSWFPSTQRGEEISDPLLAVSWGNYLTVLRVNSSHSDDLRKNGTKHRQTVDLFKVEHYLCDFCIVSLSWINRRNIVVIDQREIVHLFDIESLASPTTMGSLIKHPPLATSVNPLSKQYIERTPEESTMIDLLPSFCHSIQASKGKLLILSNTHIALGVTLSWSEHVMGLIAKGSAADAILLATQYLREGSLFFFSNLPDTIPERKEIIKEHLEDLIVASLNVLQARPDQLNVTSVKPDPNSKKLAQACIEACLEMEHFELLFSVVYHNFKEKRHLLSFFLALKNFIVNPTPSTIDMVDQLPPDLLKDLIACFASDSSLIPELEKLIFHLNPAFLDLDFTIDLCRRHMLIDALIYIWSYTLNDFITPVVEIFKIWKDSSWNHHWNTSVNINPTTPGTSPLSTTSPLETTKEKNLNAKLLCYLLEVSNGKVFPTRMPLNHPGVTTACRQLVDFLASPELLSWPYGSPPITTPHETDPDFPYFDFLISHDLDNTITLLHNLKSTILKHSLDTNLLQTMVAPCAHALTNQSHPSRNIQIAMFLSQLYNSNKITLSDSFLDSLVELLTDPAHLSKDTNDKSQDAIGLLISKYSPTFPDLITRLEAVEFYGPLKLVYHNNRQVVNEISTCFKSPTLIKEVFTILNRTKDDLSSQETSEVAQVVSENINLLVKADALSTIDLAENWLDGTHQSIVSRLDDDPEAQHGYLRALYVSNLLNENPELLYKFIFLQCVYQPSDVYPILDHLKGQTISLPFDEILKITKQHDVTDATVCILEQKGQFLQAMSEILTVLERRVNPVLAYLGRDFSSNTDKLSTNSNIIDFIQTSLLRIQAVIDIAVQLVDRTHAMYLKDFVTMRRHNAFPPFNNECERLYYMLLNAVVGAHKSIFIDTQTLQMKLNLNNALCSGVNEVFRSSIESIFNSILHPKPQEGKVVTSEIPRVVSMPRILVSIIGHTDPTKNDSSNPVFGEFREVIYSVLKTCKVESNWLHIASKLQAQDLFQLVETRHRMMSRGQRGFAPRCIQCRSRLIPLGPRATLPSSSLDPPSKKIVMFSCGHLIHETCLDTTVPTSTTTKCPKCSRL